MKKLIIEDQNEGLDSLLGEKVLLLCVNYFYSGTLVGVNEKDVLLEDGHIVYETGSWKDKGFADAQKVSDKLYVRTAAIESYTKVED